MAVAVFPGPRSCIYGIFTLKLSHERLPRAIGLHNPPPTFLSGVSGEEYIRQITFKLIIMASYIIQTKSSDISMDGEILGTHIETTSKVKKPASPFVQVYFNEDDDTLFRLSKAESGVLAMCLHRAEYISDKKTDLPGNRFNDTGDFIDETMRRTGLSESSVRNALASLVKKKVLYKDERYKGIYYLSARFFIKGHSDLRRNILDNDKTFYNFFIYIPGRPATAHGETVDSNGQQLGKLRGWLKSITRK